MDNKAENKCGALIELAKDAYKDVVHPVAENTGKVLALLPQAVNAALLPVRKWILYRDAQYGAVEQLLAKKLESVPPSEIVSPEPHVAVPALNAIAYSMDSEELRNMYANLLASSMSKNMRENVHPSYVEIIKQLMPDEARIMQFMYSYDRQIPAIAIREEFGKDDGYVDRVPCFTQLYQFVKELEIKDYNRIAIYVDNLVRLQLLQIPNDSFLADETEYVALENDPNVSSIKNTPLPEGHTWSIARLYVGMTVFGKAFCKVCIKGV